MKIVVTGAGGNVGTALLRSSRNGLELVGIARRRPPRGREPYDRARWIAAHDTTGGAYPAVRCRTG
ncbi:hypothetical protein [Nocardia fusca]|uniref:hypothetical protein n=1 Tax=Nocardia fusca TaxID=941183 RepID=UPI0007A75E1B|nr:hypothetical protein [Nocardia fusca]